MRSSPPSAEAHVGAEGASSAGPAGLGMAVVFLWGLAVQYAAQGIGGTTGRFGLHHGAARMAGYLAAALVLVVLGEGLRRGMDWARLGTLALAILVGILGVSSVLALLAGHGMPRRLVLTAAVELTLIPWIAWRLSRPRTASWFGSASGAPAAAAVLAGWLLFAVLVTIRVAAGGLRLTLPSGRPMAAWASDAIELGLVPLLALRAWMTPGPATVAGHARAGGSRVEGAWLAALVAWAVPWGILVAVTQGIGLR